MLNRIRGLLESSLSSAIACALLWLALLALPAAVMLLLGIGEPAGTAGQADLFTRLGQVLGSLRLWGLSWLLLLFACWAYGTIRRSQPGTRGLSFYTMIWLGGLVILLLAAPDLSNTAPASVQGFLVRLAEPLPLAVVWSAIMFFLFLSKGDDSAAYTFYFQPYKVVWFAFSLVVLATFLANYLVFQGILDRVDGLLTGRTLAVQTLDSLREASDNSSSRVDSVLARIDSYTRQVRQNRTFQAGPTDKDRETLLNELSNDLASLRTAVLDTYDKARRAEAQFDLAIDQEEPASGGETVEGISASPVRPVISATIGAALQALTATTDIRLEFERLQQLPLRPPSVLRGLLDDELGGKLAEVADSSATAARMLRSMSAPGMALFIWIGALYTMFILFPWLLLILFLYRKRDDRGVQILDDLITLDPSLHLLDRVLTPTTKPQSDKLKGSIEEVHAMRRSTKELTAAHLMSDAKYSDTVHKLANGLSERAFSNSEYVMTLLMLSAITAAGWYYVFYPEASVGIALLVKGGSGIEGLTSYLVRDVGPLTLGFAGAYFFVMQMLLRRYLSSDLYPAAFLQAAERLLRVFVLCLVLAVTGQVLLGSTSEAIIVGLAFLIGVWPREFERWFAAKINDLLTARFPTTVEAVPLSTLDGLNVWAETRLVEEKIENVQTLATAPIEQLVLRTHYSTAQLVDWIDQSILYLHSGHQGVWFPRLRSTGIRTATDLLDALGQHDLSPSGLRLSEPVLNDDSCKQVLAAITAVWPPDAEPKAPAMTIEVLKDMRQTIWPDPNLQYVLNYYSIIRSRLANIAQDDPPAPTPPTPRTNGLAPVAVTTGN